MTWFVLSHAYGNWHLNVRAGSSSAVADVLHAGILVHDQPARKHGGLKETRCIATRCGAISYKSVAPRVGLEPDSTIQRVSQVVEYMTSCRRWRPIVDATRTLTFRPDVDLDRLLAELELLPAAG